MNVLTSAYLTVTCAGLVAVICSLRIRDFRPRPLALFVVGGSLALATLSSFLAIYQLSQTTVSGGGALYVAGIPVNLTVIYALTASGCAAAAGFARWSSVGARPGQIT